ncbi:recombinase family protein [Xanthomonas hortorum]|uniref:recombinase family protein n=1 Tax=Xanthomonas hortorum TaxID=56454 RepID=UPI002B261CDD|nr:recombinase family protein [Xanthomonas hortorum]WOB37401.1 recombinase family protein [Xanthomonas hortorum pv. pelargonii]
MTTFVRAYLRASTDEQDAQRARSGLDQFARDRGVRICNYYAENASGARLDRAELFRLLADSRPHDVLLVEDVDRLSRLGRAEWEKLKTLIRERAVRVVAVNVPTTWQHLAPLQNEFDARMFGAINDMLLDMLAAIARRDYEQRRQRQAQGIAKAKVAGKYRGRQIDRARYGAINRLLASGSSWSVVQKTVGCSRSTISQAVKHAKLSAQAPRTELMAAASVAVILWLHVENGSKFTRGKKRVREEIDYLIATSHKSTKLSDTEYRLVIRYADDADLKQQIDDLLHEILHLADLRNCVVDDMSVKNEATGSFWDECDGGWK